MDNYNFNDNNLNYIKETIAKEKEALEKGNKPANNPYCMFVDESGNGKSPNVTKKSREECVKSLLKTLDSRPNNK